jgi:glutathione synthase
VNVLLLVESLDHADISHAFYSNALSELGHTVHVGTVNSLGWRDETFTLKWGPVTGRVEAYGPFPHEARLAPVPELDVVWLLNQPHPRLSVDVWQMLWRWNQRQPFVNDITGLLMLNNKNNLPLVVPPQNLPRSTGSNDADVFLRQLKENPHQKWILKRPNGGCGADVFILSPGDSNNRALVQSLTGNTMALSEMTEPSLVGLQAQQAVLQEHIPHAAEKRIVVSSGDVVAAQEKALTAGDHRGNMTQGAKMQLSEPTVGEHELALTVSRRLLEYGIRFAGLDVAYPHVFEVNLVNPGGLVERLELGLPDPYMGPVLDKLVRLSAGAGSASVK